MFYLNMFETTYLCIIFHIHKFAPNYKYFPHFLTSKICVSSGHTVWESNKIKKSNKCPDSVFNI